MRTSFGGRMLCLRVTDKHITVHVKELKSVECRLFLEELDNTPARM